MKILSTDELAQELAGGDSYIRTINNEVKGLAITLEKNPEAPKIIVVGTGPRIIAKAHLFLNSEKFVPVYVKQAVNRWKFLGNYKATRYVQDKDTIEKHRKHRAKDDVDGILFLVSQDNIHVTVSSTLFPDPKVRKIVEETAINFVSNYYENLGFYITDRQKDNCGYDLLVEKDKKTLKIEVKGTSLKEQRYFISRNEKQMSVDPLWRLAIVSNVLSNPELEILNSDQMEKKFSFDAICWECKVIKK